MKETWFSSNKQSQARALAGGVFDQRKHPNVGVQQPPGPRGAAGAAELQTCCQAHKALKALISWVLIVTAVCKHLFGKERRVAVSQGDPGAVPVAGLVRFGAAQRVFQQASCAAGPALLRPRCPGRFGSEGW